VIPFTRTRFLMTEERELLERAAGLALEALTRRAADPFAQIGPLLAPLGPVTDLLSARDTAMAGRGQRQPELEGLEKLLDRVVGVRALTETEAGTLRGAIRALDQETRQMMNPNNGAPLLTGPERERLRAALEGTTDTELTNDARITP
jgi:hypothetical protein